MSWLLCGLFQTAITFESVFHYFLLVFQTLFAITVYTSVGVALQLEPSLNEPKRLSGGEAHHSFSISQITQYCKPEARGQRSFHVVA